VEILAILFFEKDKTIEREFLGHKKEKYICGKFFCLLVYSLKKSLYLLLDKQYKDL